MKIKDKIVFTKNPLCNVSYTTGGYIIPEEHKEEIFKLLNNHGQVRQVLQHTIKHVGEPLPCNMKSLREEYVETYNSKKKWSI